MSRWGGRFVPNAENELRRTAKEPVSIWRKEWIKVTPNSSYSVLKWVKTGATVDFSAEEEQDEDADEGQELAAVEAVEAVEAAEANADNVEQGEVTAEAQEIDGLSEGEADTQQAAQVEHNTLPQEQTERKHAQDDGQERIQEAGIQQQAEGQSNISDVLASAGEKEPADMQATAPVIQQDRSGEGEKELGDLLDDAEMAENENALVPPMTDTPLPGGGQDPAAQSSKE